jgi:hypothetical protein
MESPIWLMFTLGLLSAAPARADDLLRPDLAAKGQIDQVATADEENEASEHEYWCGGPRSFRSCVSTILRTDREIKKRNRISERTGRGFNMGLKPYWLCSLLPRPLLPFIR